MDLRQVERQRTGLVHFTVVLILIFLALSLFGAWQRTQSNLTQALLILSLAACLFVMAKERVLRHLHDALIHSALSDSQRRRVEGSDELSQLEDPEPDPDPVRILEQPRDSGDSSNLYSAVVSLSTIRDPEPLFGATMRAALDLVGADQGSLMVLDEARQQLVFASSVGLDAEIVSRPGPRVGDGVAGWVAVKRKAVLLTGNVASDPRFRNRVHDGRRHAGLALPLELRGRLLGVLNLGLSAEAKRTRFSAEELQQAMLFAHYVAALIEPMRVDVLRRFPEAVKVAV